MDNYFEYRNVKEDFYKEYKLPKYLQKKLGENKSIRILDIGCGFGQTLLSLKKLGYTSLNGIDISAPAIESCNKEGLDTILIKDIIDYCKKFQGEKFDFIIMSHLLEHLDKNIIIDTLKNIKTYLLKENTGAVCAMVPNAQSNTGCYWAYEDFTHNTLFTAGSVYFVFKAAGYSTIEFLDPKGIENFNIIIRTGFNVLLYIYRMNKKFWNLVTLSSFHKPSPQIYTYEIKAFAR